jgi:hypothetical protein
MPSRSPTSLLGCIVGGVLGVESFIIVVRRITMDVLQILVPLFTAMLGYAVGYFVKKSEYERQRKDELADREHNRRLEYRDKRISEAQECLNIFTEAAKMIMNVETTAVAHKNADVVKANALKILPLLDLPTNTLMSVQFLDSPELAQVTHEFRVLIYDEHQRMMQLLIALHNKKDVDEKAINARMSEFVNDSGRYSGKIQVLLNKLASETK